MIFKGCGEKGQSFLEYMVFITVLIVISLFIFSDGGYFKESYKKMIEIQGNGVMNAVDEIFN